jgi:hypothetical protein
MKFSVTRRGSTASPAEQYLTKNGDLFLLCDATSHYSRDYVVYESQNIDAGKIE